MAMRKNSDGNRVDTTVLAVIKASLDDLETKALNAGTPLAAHLIGAASEAISDELVAMSEPLCYRVSVARRKRFPLIGEQSSRSP